MTHDAPPPPPRYAERLVRLAIRDSRWREVTLGDLGEEHGARAATVGRAAADWWYRGQALALAAGAIASGVRAFILPSGDSVMRGLFRDCVLTFRSFRRQPLMSAIIVLTLALGLGANAATFGMIDSLLLRPFPFPNVDRLVVLSENSPADPFAQEAVAPATYLDVTAAAPRSFTRHAAASWWDVNLSGGDQPELVQGTRVTPDFFPMLSAAPALGRGFTESDATWGNHRVAVLSDGLWRRRFGGDAQVIGRSVRIDGEVYVVVGVAPPTFDFPNATEVRAPLAFDADDVVNRGDHYLTVFEELRPGATVADAQAEMAVLYAPLKQRFPDETRDRDLIVRTFSSAMIDFGMPRVLAMWQAAALLVLIIGCVNVASLLLARGADRQREMAVRLAIGAGRAQIVRQLLFEAVIIAVISVPAALGVGWLAFQAIRSAMPAEIVRFLPGWMEMGIDPRVVAFTFVAAVGAAFLFGLIPALQISRPRLTSTLADGGRSATAGIARSRLRRALVVGEVAIALPLLVLSGLAAMGAYRFANGPQGYEPDQVMRMRLRLPAAVYPDAAARRLFSDRLLDEARAIPGATSVATTNAAPSSATNPSTTILLDGVPPPEGALPTVRYRAVSPSYFEAMGMPIVEGRAILASDRDGRERVAIVSQAMARRFWPEAIAIGQRIRFAPEDEETVVLVGVVGDTIHDWFGSRHEPTVYVPVAQRPSSSVFLVARAARDPEALVPGMRAALARVDASQPAFDVVTMRQAIYQRTTGIRFVGALMAAFGGLALLLATFGIYGVMAHFVAQRRSEIGVRMALGATRRDVLRLTMSSGARLAAIGIAIGLVLGIGLARVMESALFGVISLEPSLFIAITVALSTVALLATLVPATHASRVDPIAALRD